MLNDYRPIVKRAEADAAGGAPDRALRQLRRLSLRDFGDLMWQLPLAEFPALSAMLPRMASDEVQQAWTGSSGGQMLNSSVDFIRIVQAHFERICRRPLQRARILDYGCGYGRLARLMYWYSDPEDYYGVDPWDRSIELCRDSGLLGRIAQSEYFPETLPVGEQRFDLIYAYSIFTHTSLRATRAALTVLRNYIHSTGLLVITVRPVDFWPIVTRIAPEERQNQIVLHQRDGFAYVPDTFPVIEGEVIFGDTSMTPEWIERQFPFWRVEAYDRGIDPWQTILMLTPR